MKPIIVIRFPAEISEEQFHEGMKSFERGEDLRSDYHLLFTKDAWTGGRIEIECVNTKATETELNTLQEKILELIKTEP